MLQLPVATVVCGQEMLSRLERIWVKFLQKAEMSRLVTARGGRKEARRGGSCPPYQLAVGAEQRGQQQGEPKVIFPLADPLGQPAVSEVRTPSLHPMTPFTFLAGHSEPLVPGISLAAQWLQAGDILGTPKPCAMTPQSSGMARNLEVGLSPDSLVHTTLSPRATVVPPESRNKGKVTCCSSEVKQSSSQTTTGRAKIIY